MKQLFRAILYKKCLFVALMLAASLCGQSQTTAELYFDAEEMPDMRIFLPEPPDTTSAAFAHDIMQYMWGKTQRLDPERADIARRDAVFGMEVIVSEFSDPFGLQISETDTPEIYRVLLNGLLTCDCICTLPKHYYGRKRPYVRFNEPTLIPEREGILRNDGSYPSAHAVLGWSAALLLMEINPEAQDTLLARGYMYGESRVVAGYHWQSDIDAGRLAAAAAYAKLHTSERFLEHMAKARKEFAEKKEQFSRR